MAALGHFDYLQVLGLVGAVEHRGAVQHPVPAGHSVWHLVARDGRSPYCCCPSTPADPGHWSAAGAAARVERHGPDQFALVRVVQRPQMGCSSSMSRRRCHSRCRDGSNRRLMARMADRAAPGAVRGLENDLHLTEEIRSFTGGLEDPPRRHGNARGPGRFGCRADVPGPG